MAPSPFLCIIPLLISWVPASIHLHYHFPQEKGQFCGVKCAFGAAWDPSLARLCLESCPEAKERIGGRAKGAAADLAPKPEPFPEDRFLFAKAPAPIPV